MLALDVNSKRNMTTSKNLNLSTIQNYIKESPKALKRSKIHRTAKGAAKDTEATQKFSIPDDRIKFHKQIFLYGV